MPFAMATDRVPLDVAPRLSDTVYVTTPVLGPATASNSILVVLTMVAEPFVDETIATRCRG
jgi:hypothetical protein